MRTWLVLGIAASCLSAQEIQLWLTKLLMTGEERGDLKRDKSVDFSPKRQKLFFFRMPFEMPLHVPNNCNALLKFSLSSSASWCWSRFSQSRQRTSLCYSSEPEHMSGISSIPQSASASALTIDIIFSLDQVSLGIGNVQQFPPLLLTPCSIFVCRHLKHCLR